MRCASALPGCTLLPGLIDFHSHVGIDTRRSDLASQVQVPPSRYLAAGIGFRFPVSFAGTADFDYGYTDMKLLGAAHRFSLKFAF